jgi:hypothetical protein
MYQGRLTAPRQDAVWKRDQPIRANGKDENAKVIRYGPEING